MSWSIRTTPREKPREPRTARRSVDQNQKPRPKPLSCEGIDRRDNPSESFLFSNRRYMNMPSNPFAEGFVHFQTKWRTTRLYISSRDQFCVPERRHITQLADADLYARGYIEACSSPLGLEVDEPLCK